MSLHMDFFSRDSDLATSFVRPYARHQNPNLSVNESLWAFMSESLTSRSSVAHQLLRSRLLSVFCLFSPKHNNSLLVEVVLLCMLSITKIMSKLWYSKKSSKNKLWKLIINLWIKRNNYSNKRVYQFIPTRLPSMNEFLNSWILIFVKRFKIFIHF